MKHWITVLAAAVSILGSGCIARKYQTSGDLKEKAAISLADVRLFYAADGRRNKMSWCSTTKHGIELYRAGGASCPAAWEVEREVGFFLSEERFDDDFFGAWGPHPALRITFLGAWIDCGRQSTGCMVPGKIYVTQYGRAGLWSGWGVTLHDELCHESLHRQGLPDSGHTASCFTMHKPTDDIRQWNSPFGTRFPGGS